MTKTRLAIAVIAIAIIAPATAFATHVFDDVPDGAFFAEPVEWASSNGITFGKTADLFDPDAGVTRGESVTFLKRYDDNIAQPALEPVAIAIGHLEVEGGGTVTVTGTEGLTATYDLATDRFTVSLAGASLTPSTHVVHVTPIRINTGAATEDRSGQTFFGSGSVQISVWDSDAGGSVITDVHISIHEL